MNAGNVIIVLICLLVIAPNGWGGIAQVVPDSAYPGDSGKTIAFTLEADPPLPPLTASITNITIGTIAARVASLSWDGTVASGIFDFPTDVSVGTKDCKVYFDMPVFEGSGLFTILPDANSPPVITTEPESLIVQPGDRANFRVDATGAEPLTYQWQTNGVNIAGATTNAYSILSAADSDEMDYRCIIGNANGAVTSAVATLTVSATTPYPGYNLFSGLNDTNTYLVDNFGREIHTWTSPYGPGNALYLLGDR